MLARGNHSYVPTISGHLALDRSALRQAQRTLEAGCDGKVPTASGVGEATSTLSKSLLVDLVIARRFPNARSCGCVVTTTSSTATTAAVAATAATPPLLLLYYCCCYYDYDYDSHHVYEEEEEEDDDDENGDEDGDEDDGDGNDDDDYDQHYEYC